MPAQLMALSEGPNLLLDKPILLLGRHAECDIQLNSRKVSRRHCCIAQVSNYLVVRDLGSTNGIRINGVRVLEGRLKSGDELTVGNFRYQVSWDDKPISALPARQEAPAAANAKSSSGAAKEPVPAIRHVPTDSDEDQILESCDDPVLLGSPRKRTNADKNHQTPPPEPKVSSSLFPESVNLLGDSKLGLTTPPSPPH